ncbi:MAG: MerR family transcriptional regulator [Gemmatimonadales bacterium]|nr:MerR family transcriptional regulator [Gemmatimonadales bacterium]
MTNAAELQTPRYPVRLVSLRTGLSPHVLRAWERRYGVVQPTRTEGGQRLYSELDIERLLRLRRLTDRGHAIRRIASLPLDELDRLDEEIAGEGRMVRPHLAGDEADQMRAASVGDSIAAAMQATRRLDAVELQAVLERAAVTLGVPVFLDEVVAPTLVRIGHGWAERSVSVAQEHMATAVFRRVLGWLFRVYEVRGTAPRLVVATPPSQVHELGALMVAASAAAEGWGVTYLGPDLPVADLVSAVRQTDAQAVAISAVHVPKGGDLLGALREMRAGLPTRVPLLVGGAATPEIRSQAEAAGALVLASLPDFRALLRRLAAEKAE